jgi:hypothetical protein
MSKCIAGFYVLEKCKQNSMKKYRMKKPDSGKMKGGLKGQMGEGGAVVPHAFCMKSHHV